MEIKFTDTFFKSLKRMINRERWYWKTVDFFRYDLINGVKNIFFFWKEIWNYRGWDYTFQLRLLKKSLEPLSKYLTEGNEEDISRLKKVDKINRAIKILENICDDNYIELAEKELGYTTNSDFLFGKEPKEVTEANRKIFHLADEIEEREWSELFEILKGQDRKSFKEQYKSLSVEEKIEGTHWNSWFDGSGMRGWWD